MYAEKNLSALTGYLVSLFDIRQDGNKGLTEERICGISEGRELNNE